MKFIDILYFTTNIQDKLYQQRKYPIENFPKLKKKKKNTKTLDPKRNEKSSLYTFNLRSEI